MGNIMKKDEEDIEIPIDNLLNLLSNLGSEEIELKNDLHTFEYTNLYAKFLNANQKQREEYIYTFITNIKDIIYKYFDDDNKDKFSAKLHKIKSKQNPNVSTILEISCPDVKIEPMAKTIYICFNLDYSEFRYFTIEYGKLLASSKQYYFIGEQKVGKHLNYGQLNPDKNEIDTILNITQ